MKNDREINDATPAEPSPLLALVRAALRDNANDGRAALETVRRRLRRDSAARAAILEEAIQKAIDYYVRLEHHQQRDELAASGPRQDTLAGYAAVASDSLMDWPLRGGKPIGAATRLELTVESAWAFKTSRTYFANAKWFKAIAADLPDDVTPVRQRFTEADLRTLRHRAEGKHEAAA